MGIATISHSNGVTIKTDKTFNLTEYYALKSVKLSDAYRVTFTTYEVKFNDLDTKVADITDKVVSTDIFYCESLKLPTIKNEVHKLEAGSMGNKYSVFSHKPFDEISMKLIESDDSNVYKFIIDRITKRFSPYRHVYVFNQLNDKGDSKYYKMDCWIEIFDNSFTDIKMKIMLDECDITNYSNSTFNSNDTSTPYSYDITLSFNGITYEYFR